MVAGLIVMTGIWGWTSVAFTWYVLIGATTTCLVAWLLARTLPASGAMRDPAA
jgi:hypothetical protein